MSSDTSHPGAETAIRTLLEDHAAALRAKDAAAVVSHHAADFVQFSLAPPLLSTGAETDGTHNDLWFRQTLGLRRIGGAWKIAHEHDSVPFYMDGSLRAAVDLKP